MNDFVHLHVHTQYSILDGQASVARLVDKAIADGQKAIAITDHGNMFGVKEFVDYIAKKNKETEVIKPIIGCEVYVARNGKLNQRKEVREDARGWHLILLAKNYAGYKNLLKIVSRAWVDGYYYAPRTDWDDLEQYHENLIACSACLGGQIPRYLLNGQLEEAEATVLRFKRVFGDDFYLEMQRHQPTVSNAAQDTYPKQVEVNRHLVELARKHQVKLIATNDVHFVDKDDAEAHHHLLCINTNNDLNDLTRMAYTKQEWFKTREEMGRVFADLPEALVNTCEIADKVAIYSIDHGPIMPTFEIPTDFGTEEGYRQRFSEQDLFEEFTRDENGQVVLSEEEAKQKIQKLGGIDRLYRIKLEADYLKLLTMKGAERCYPDMTPEVKERLNFELHIMKTMGFPGYFLIVQDFIAAAQEQLGVWVGPGRGSAAGSAVAYCLGITKVDPIRYDLLFERFLNPDRISLPDIDVDFDDDGRGEVLRWVENKYGKEKVAHIITYGTMAAKMAIKDVARVRNLPLSESNRLAKLIPDRLEDENGKSVKINLKNAIKYVPELAAACQSDDEQVSLTMKYACQLEGNVRNIGVHACGVIIGRDDISDWVPVSTATDKQTNEKLLVTQYEGSVIESTGLIKMDFLGLKTLSILKEAVSNVRKSRGIEVELDKISLEDAKTYELYCAGNTIGTFQFESPGMQKYLRELQPSQFEDLIAMNALYRPGPMDNIPDFINRKQGRSPIEYDLPVMEKYLKETYGITVYQEQVMLLSRLLAGFTRGQSDELRKAMGKKLKEKLDKLKPKFINGGKANGHDEQILEKIWSDWEKFASYAFNKSHATCYSLVAFQTAYMKANFPPEYMAAVLTRNLDNIKELTKLITECKQMKIKVLLPDVNESDYHFMVNKDGNIRFGLGAIKGMGEAAVNTILEERAKNGPFASVYDFVERVNLSTCGRKSFESLVLSGAFDGFTDIRREQYFDPPSADGKLSHDNSFVSELLRYGAIYQEDKTNLFGNLFGDQLDESITRPLPPPPSPLWNKLHLLKMEKDYVGMYLSSHPLDDYAVFLNHVCNCRIEDIKDEQLQPDKNYLFAAMVTNVDVRKNKQNDDYARVTLEDDTASIELTFFSKQYANFRNLLVKDAFLTFHGQYAKKRWSDDYELSIQQVELLSQDVEHMVRTVVLKLPQQLVDEPFVRQLAAVTIQRPGKVKLRLELHDRSQSLPMKVSFASDCTFQPTRDLLDFLANFEAVSLSVDKN